MTEPTPETLHPWLDSATVLAWLQIDETNETALTKAETCRVAAANWCEDQRRDLWTVPETEEEAPVFEATDRIVMAGVLATSRLYARTDSPAGLVSFGELGAASVLRTDPDVGALLGINQRPEFA